MNLEKIKEYLEERKFEIDMQDDRISVYLTDEKRIAVYYISKKSNGYLLSARGDREDDYYLSFNKDLGLLLLDCVVNFDIPLFNGDKNLLDDNIVYDKIENDKVCVMKKDNYYDIGVCINNKFYDIFKHEVYENMIDFINIYSKKLSLFLRKIKEFKEKGILEDSYIDELATMSLSGKGLINEDDYYLNYYVSETMSK